MPLFYFHYRTPDQCNLDDTGCSFESLEHAYLDAYRSMVEIGAELLKEQVDPASHRIEIADRDGRVLMELRFDEVFRRRRQSPAFVAQAEEIRRKLRDFRRLRRDMSELCHSARISVENAHAVLRRARAMM